jgi:myo-inositol-1(or 4)-monophosphatase
MNDAELRHLGRVALEVAREAASGLLAGYRMGVTATEKGRADLVTEYDVATERLIRARLQERTPELAIGTTNFVHGHPFFCVSLGLYARGQALLGAVVAPLLGVEWHGVVGQGAFRNGTPCKVSATRELRDALVTTGFHPGLRAQELEENVGSFIAVLSEVRDIRRCGSAALDLCFVADGTYDAYWERSLHPWDTIGGGAIALAAGARITNLRGGPVDLRIGHLVASNGLVHDALLRLLPEQRA